MFKAELPIVPLYNQSMVVENPLEGNMVKGHKKRTA